MFSASFACRFIKFLRCLLQFTITVSTAHPTTAATHSLMGLDCADDGPLVIEDAVIRGQSAALRERDRRSQPPVNGSRGAEHRESDGSNECGLRKHVGEEMRYDARSGVSRMDEVERFHACYLSICGSGGRIRHPVVRTRIQQQVGYAGVQHYRRHRIHVRIR